MLYLNSEHISSAGLDWEALLQVIQDALAAMGANDYSQPVKPYLRYRDPKNRIIAMPAFVGGRSAFAGIKWIASFPANIYQGKPRANSVTILNEPDTGIPLCVINTAVVSAIRTAAVSALMIREYSNLQPARRYRIGIVGFGPVGKMHFRMINAVLKGRINGIALYDTREIIPEDIPLVPEEPGKKGPLPIICRSWQECYDEADILITCTVAERPYIDRAPPKGSLQMNISLRDYLPSMRRCMDLIVVDDWVEVCRENTDIENMHKQCELTREETIAMGDLICGGRSKWPAPDKVIMFNPMGMAAFDIAIGGYYFQKALGNNIGIRLPV